MDLATAILIVTDDLTNTAEACGCLEALEIVLSAASKQLVGFVGCPCISREEIA